MAQASLHELIRRAAAKARAVEAEERMDSGEQAGMCPGAGDVFSSPGMGDDLRGRGVPGHLRPGWAAVRIGPGKRGRVLRWFGAAAARGEFAVGERLPGERRVAAALGVSRDTVRAAMHELAAAGWLEPGTRGQGWRFVGGGGNGDETGEASEVSGGCGEAGGGGDISAQDMRAEARTPREAGVEVVPEAGAIPVGITGAGVMPGAGVIPGVVPKGVPGVVPGAGVGVGKRRGSGRGVVGLGATRGADRYTEAMKTRKAKLGVGAGLLALACGGGVGCVQRTISITSEPAGALVWLNDEEVGRTPVAVPFRWYGVYDVRLEKDGFEPKWTTGEAQMPWWELPGPDLVAEMLPGAESRVAWHYEMTAEVPAAEQDVPALIERAKGMRDETRGFAGD